MGAELNRFDAVAERYRTVRDVARTVTYLSGIQMGISVASLLDGGEAFAGYDKATLGVAVTVGLSSFVVDTTCGLLLSDHHSGSNEGASI